jgi:hypothetical protein
MKFKAIKDSGKLKINWDRIEAYLSNFKDGTSFEVEITRRQKTRSTPLRAYYFGAVLPVFMEALGYDKDETLNFHRQLKIIYFQVKQDKRGIYRDKEIPSVFSDDSTIPVPEKQKFIAWVIRKAAENGIYIEDPNESKT